MNRTNELWFAFRTTNVVASLQQCANTHCLPNCHFPTHIQGRHFILRRHYRLWFSLPLLYNLPGARTYYSRRIYEYVGSLNLPLTRPTDLKSNKSNFFHMKKLLKVMVRKEPFDSQMKNLCVLRHHFLIYKIFGNDLYL